MLKRHGETILVVHYEDTLKNPRKILEAVDRHWHLNLTPAAIDAALQAGTKEAMAEKVDPEAEPNVLQNRKTSLADLFSGEAMDIYRRKIAELFRYDLGYDLLTPPA